MSELKLTPSEFFFLIHFLSILVSSTVKWHPTDKYSQHSQYWLVWLVWLNGRVFVYKLSGCGFESRCSHLLFSMLYLLGLLDSLHHFIFKFTGAVFHLSTSKSSTYVFKLFKPVGTLTNLLIINFSLQCNKISLSS